jgi:hypothetical protein
MPTTFAAGRGKLTSLDFVVKEVIVVEHQLRHKKCDWVARDVVIKIDFPKSFLGRQLRYMKLGFFAIDFILRMWIEML